jgi:hypothetical protein
MYLSNAIATAGGLRLLAFFLSLPLILLSWSLVTFTISIIVYAFGHTLAWRSHVVMGVVLFSIVGVVVAAVMFFRKIFGTQR